MSYEVWIPQKVEVGSGLLNKLGTILAGRKAFIVAYKDGKKSSVIVDRLLDILEKRSVEFIIYRGVRPDPDIRCIDEGAALCGDENCDLVLGIGGGSVLDAAKSIALLTANPGSIRDYQMGCRKFAQKGLPVYAIPTTSGSGSEATRVSVISNREEGIKKSISHPYLMPEYVLIDPELTLTLPEYLTFTTGMDALSHAVESYCSLNANQVTSIFSLEAIRLITCSLEKAVKNPGDLKARTDMALGSYFAGVALNAGVGAVHIMAQPMGAVYGISHGEACSILLPVVMKLNYKYCVDKFVDIARAMGIDTSKYTREQAALKSIEHLEKMYYTLGMPVRISQLGDIKLRGYEELKRNIASSTGHINTNPRPVTDELLYSIFEMAG